MKSLNIYKNKYLLQDEDSIFNFLTTTLTDSIKYWDYFVNWNKVKKNVSDLEIDLNTLNYLVGKENIEEEFKKLITKSPSIVKLLPIILACRDKDFRILTSYSNGDLVYEDYHFNKFENLSKEDIDKINRFAKETGLLDIFQKKIIKSVPDYVTGIEVGLDSNGRKNRSGTAMEKIVESFLKLICEKHGFDYLPQADSSKVKLHWDIDLHVDRSDRKFDFVVRKENKIFLIETNFYGGGGSKLKATAGEYKSLFDFAKSHNYVFIWITDGFGWKSTLFPLREAFDKLNFILNLRMITDGVLDEILLNYQKS